MDDILDYIAGIIREHAGCPVLLGLAADAPDDAIIISQYGAAPPFFTFGGVYHTYGVKMSARSRDVKAARAAVHRIEDAIRRRTRDEYDITPAAPVMCAGQDEKQRHVYTVSYEVREI